MKKADIKAKIDTIMSDDSFGNIHRAKGFFLDDGIWYQFNATKEDFELNTMPVGQEVFIVIGEDLNQDKIKEYMNA